MYRIALHSHKKTREERIRRLWMVHVRVLTLLFCFLALLENYVCASLVVFCSSFVKSSIAVCILNFIFAIAGTFLNTMVLFLFLKSKNMRRKTSYVAIMILSATDLTVITIVIQPCFYLRQSLKFWAHRVVCTAFVLI